MQENSAIKLDRISFVAKTFFLFFFLYDVVFMGVPTLFSTRKISFVVFVVWALVLFLFANVRKELFEYETFRNVYIALAVVTAISVPYTIFRARFHGVLDTAGAEYPVSVFFILYCLIAPVAISYIYRSREEFCRSVMFVTFAQSIFVLFEFKTARFKDFLTKVVDDSNANIKFIDDKRATCLGASGSMATVMLAFGVWITGWYIIRQVDKISWIWLCWLILALSIVAEFLCGKTGFYISVLNLIIILIMYLARVEAPGRAWRNIGIVLGSFGLIFGLWYGFYGSKVYEIKEKFRHVFNLSVEFGSSKYSFWTRFNEGDIPPMSLDVLFDLGIFRGDTNNGLSIHHDGGYVQRFVAEGVLFAALEYILLFVLIGLLIYQIEGIRSKLYFWVLTIALFVIEFKEPFIYKYAPVAMIMSVLFMEKSAFEEGYVPKISFKLPASISATERQILIRKLKKAIKYRSLISANAKTIKTLFSYEAKTFNGRFMSMDDKIKWQNGLLEFNKFKPEESVTIAEHFLAENVVLKKSTYKVNSIPSDEPILLCNVRDDLEKIKNVIEHHKKMGIRYFAILDNGSKDGTLEYLLDQDIDVFTVEEQYTSIVRAAWMMKIASYYGFDRWYVVLDSDELLAYPGGKTGDIKEIIGDLKSHNVSRGLAMMVDMYAEESDLKNTKKKGDLLKRYRFFDTDSYERRTGDFYREIFGGPRTRVFGNSGLDNRELLTKYPVFYWRKGEIYRYHYVFPFEENFDSPLVLALKHYKFTEGDYEKMVRIVKEGNYAGGSNLYENYVEKLPEDGKISFKTDKSGEIKDDASLLEIDIMEKFNGKI